MERRIAIIGLGYVGLGLAVSLSKHYKLFGYDISTSRLEALQAGVDKNQLVTQEELFASPIEYTDDIQTIKSANFFIVTVSTPAYFYQLPNLDPLESATKAIGCILKKGDIVVYESTVYPGTTEEVCLPILEKESDLKCGVDFFLGYSPERISPHDRQYSLSNITKIISAQDEQSLAVIRDVYSHCCEKLYPVSNIKTAEAIKILENTQRDVNIALMNEFSQIMHALNLNVHEIIEGAKTKWSFVPFKPGFVGGHCIAVDPLYLAFKAKRVGINPDLIMTARKINDGITQFVISEVQRLLSKHDLSANSATIGVFGIAYKENTTDIRNSLALKFIKELKLAGLTCQVNDPLADKQIVKKHYDLDLKDFTEMHSLSIAIVTVGHDYYREQGLDNFIKKFTGPVIVLDIPNIFVDVAHQYKNINYWNL